MSDEHRCEVSKGDHDYVDGKVDELYRRLLTAEHNIERLQNQVNGLMAREAGH
jgi:hypothetical protein